VDAARLRALSASSVQQQYAPEGRCFGCGPANERGLRIASHQADGELVADWRPEPHHEAFDGVLNGGIIGALLDCHSNWAAALHLMQAAGADRPPSCVTADYAIHLVRPTPTDRMLHLRARVVDATGRRATVDAQLEADGETTATCHGTFVAVGPEHAAFGRW